MQARASTQVCGRSKVTYLCEATDILLPEVRNVVRLRASGGDSVIEATTKERGSWKKGLAKGRAEAGCPRCALSVFFVGFKKKMRRSYAVTWGALVRCLRTSATLHVPLSPPLFRTCVSAEGDVAASVVESTSLGCASPLSLFLSSCFYVHVCGRGGWEPHLFAAAGSSAHLSLVGGVSKLRNTPRGKPPLHCCVSKEGGPSNSFL